MKRFQDALGLSDGAQDTETVVKALNGAIAEVVSEGGSASEIKSDPAVRVLAHVLAYSCDAYSLQDGSQRRSLLAACQRYLVEEQDLAPASI